MNAYAAAAADGREDELHAELDALFNEQNTSSDCDVDPRDVLARHRRGLADSYSVAHGQTLVQIQSVGVAYRAALAISILCVIGAGTTTAVRADVGARGWVTTAIGTRFDQANAVARQPNGRLVVAGSSDRTGFAVARYLPSGVLDASFGRGGIVRTAVYDGASALAIQPDGKIVLAGNTVDRFALARYTSDGRLDKNFGRGGRTTTAFGDFANAYALVRQPDGKLVVAGSQSRATGGDSVRACSLQRRRQSRFDLRTPRPSHDFVRRIRRGCTCTRPSA